MACRRSITAEDVYSGAATGSPGGMDWRPEGGGRVQVRGRRAGGDEAAAAGGGPQPYRLLPPQQLPFGRAALPAVGPTWKGCCVARRWQIIEVYHATLARKSDALVGSLQASGCRAPCCEA